MVVTMSVNGCVHLFSKELLKSFIGKSSYYVRSYLLDSRNIELKSCAYDFREELFVFDDNDCMKISFHFIKDVCKNVSFVFDGG